jgi:hypothetical protein
MEEIMSMFPLIRPSKSDDYPTNADRAVAFIPAAIFFASVILGGIVCRNFDLITVQLNIDAASTYTFGYAIEVFKLKGQDSVTTHAGIISLALLQIKVAIEMLVAIMAGTGMFLFRKNPGNQLIAVGLASMPLLAIVWLERLNDGSFEIGANQISAICVLLCILTVFPIGYKVCEGYDRHHPPEG